MGQHRGYLHAVVASLLFYYYIIIIIIVIKQYVLVWSHFMVKARIMSEGD